MIEVIFECKECREENYKVLHDTYNLKTFDDFTQCENITLNCKSCGAENDFVLTLKPKSNKTAEKKES